MGLKDLTLPSKVVKFSDGEFTVRGLSYFDISKLAKNHLPAMTALFNKIVAEARSGAKSEDIGKFVKMAMDIAPEFISEAIAYAADEPLMSKQAGKLPFSVQTSALIHIAELSLGSEAEVEKLLEAVLQVSQSVQKVLVKASSPSTTGYGESGET